VGDKLSPPSKEHSGNTLSSEQQTSNAEEEIQSPRHEVESLDTRIAQSRYPVPEFTWMVGYERAQGRWEGFTQMYTTLSRLTSGLAIAMDLDLGNSCRRAKNEVSLLP